MLTVPLKANGQAPRLVPYTLPQIIGMMQHVRLNTTKWHIVPSVLKLSLAYVVPQSINH